MSKKDDNILDEFDDEIIDNIQESPKKENNKIKVENVNDIESSYIDINIEEDENKEKHVIITFELPSVDKPDETMMIDLKISKKTFLMIAEELFK